MTETFGIITKQIKNYDNFIIVAHKSIDLDAYGSALCLYQILKSFEKTVFILLNETIENSSIIKSMEILEKQNIEIDYIYEDDLNLKKDNTLVIIIDTNKRSLLESSRVLDIHKDVMIIDHHIVSEDTIKNTLFSYINSDVSSTTEIIVRYLKYLNKTVSPTIATIALTGLVIDTSNFNLKTTDKTYEVAAILMQMGADNVQKQQLLKEDKESYLKRQIFIKNSQMIRKNTALCVMDKNIYKRHDLALIAEDLLQFDDVEISFAIGFVGKKQIGISARSIGEIDVEKYMRKLGGGGHKTDAACTIKSNSLEKVKRKLLKIIKK